MAYYDYLCDLLSPLGIYQLAPDTCSGAELKAAGEGLDDLALQLSLAERESITTTAQEEGLTRREQLFPRCPVKNTIETRRRAIEALSYINSDGFTLKAINQAIDGCGIHAVARETDQYGIICVCFPGVAGEPEGFSQICGIIEDIIPCHLQVEYVFHYLTWEECETIGYTWYTVEQAGYTWETFPNAVIL